MSFYVYENWTHDRARIHRAICGYCNDGRGTQVSSAERNGKWHGPFSDSDTATRVAASLKRTDTKPCRTCAP